MKKTPDDIKVKLVACKLRGKALAAFNCFKNLVGQVGDPDTTTWAEFKAWALSALAVDKILKRDRLETMYQCCKQKGSAEAFVETYRNL
eukprot:2760865-Rhodomonas_salina.1